MLEDFIQVNEIEAKILPYAAKGKLVKCVLFSGPINVVALVFVGEKISIEKLEEAVDASPFEQTSILDVEDITGYSAKFLPPISVYGVKVVLDSKVAKAFKVRCIIGDEKTLEMLPKDILLENEDSLEADITL